MEDTGGQLRTQTKSLVRVNGSDCSLQVDSNANITTGDDTLRENGYDHPPAEHTNGYDSGHEEDAFVDDGIAT